MTDQPRVALGDQGEWVDYVRQVLESQGYAPGQGSEFDATLDAVVRQYQSDKGLTADGAIGDRTWAALVPSASIEIDWSALPWLSMLARYEATEDGVRQFLIDNKISAELLAVQE